MKDTTLLSMLMNLPAHWQMSEVVPNLYDGSILLKMTYPRTTDYSCPQCSKRPKICGYEHRTVEHTEQLMHYKTLMSFEVPKIYCQEHGDVSFELFS
jgi:hypothetical protein